MDRRIVSTLVLVMLLMLTIVYWAAAFFIAVAALAILIADIWTLEKWGGGGQSATAPKKSTNTINTLNAARKSAKQARIDKVLAEVQAKGGITNDEVQAMLGVSDATAERYLEELERSGKIAQIGKSGRTVSYKAL